MLTSTEVGWPMYFHEGEVLETFGPGSSWTNIETSGVCLSPGDAPKYRNWLADTLSLRRGPGKSMPEAGWINVKTLAKFFYLHDVPPQTLKPIRRGDFLKKGSWKHEMPEANLINFLILSFVYISRICTGTDSPRRYP